MFLYRFDAVYLFLIEISRKKRGQPESRADTSRHLKNKFYMFYWLFSLKVYNFSMFLYRFDAVYLLFLIKIAREKRGQPESRADTSGHEQTP